MKGRQSETSWTHPKKKYPDMKDQNLNIADQDTSVDVGEHIQEQARLIIIDYFQRRSNDRGGGLVGLFSFATYSDLDWVLIEGGEVLGFVEFKGRSNKSTDYGGQTIIPIEKIKIAQVLLDSLKVRCYAVIYFQGDETFWIFNLLKYVKIDTFTRWDRDTKRTYAVYDLNKAQKLEITK